MKKIIPIIMAMCFMFIITGCSKTNANDIKTGTKDAEVNDNNESDGDEEDANNEDTNNEDKSVDDSTELEEYDLVMTTEKDSYPSNVNEIILTIYNNSNNELYYGEAFKLEQEIDNEWLEVEPVEELFFIEIAYSIKANDSSQITTHLSGYGGDLKLGHYRIIKDVTKVIPGKEEDEGTSENITLAAEFNVSNESSQVGRLASVYIDMENDTYKKGEKVSYKIGNNTEEAKNVVLAPRLEKEVEDGWEWVECTTGFCGTPDSLNDIIEGEIDLEWYPSLVEGIYRLSFEVQDEGAEPYNISDIFSYIE